MYTNNYVHSSVQCWRLWLAVHWALPDKKCPPPIEVGIPDLIGSFKDWNSRKFD